MRTVRPRWDPRPLPRAGGQPWQARETRYSAISNGSWIISIINIIIITIIDIMTTMIIMTSIEDYHKYPTYLNRESIEVST